MTSIRGHDRGRIGKLLPTDTMCGVWSMVQQKGPVPPPADGELIRIDAEGVIKRMSVRLIMALQATYTDPDICRTVPPQPPYSGQKNKPPVECQPQK